MEGERSSLHGFLQRLSHHDEHMSPVETLFNLNAHRKPHLRRAFSASASPAPPPSQVPSCTPSESRLWRDKSELLSSGSDDCSIAGHWLLPPAPPTFLSPSAVLDRPAHMAPSMQCARTSLLANPFSGVTNPRRLLDLTIAALLVLDFCLPLCPLSFPLPLRWTESACMAPSMQRTCTSPVLH
jgi:hypothetical protein